MRENTAMYENLALASTSGYCSRELRHTCTCNSKVVCCQLRVMRDFWITGVYPQACSDKTGEVSLVLLFFSNQDGKELILERRSGGVLITFNINC